MDLKEEIRTENIDHFNWSVIFLEFQNDLINKKEHLSAIFDTEHTKDDEVFKRVCYNNILIYIDRQIKRNDTNRLNVLIAYIRDNY